MMSNVLAWLAVDSGQPAGPREAWEPWNTDGSMHDIAPGAFPENDLFDLGEYDTGPDSEPSIESAALVWIGDWPCPQIG